MTDAPQQPGTPEQPSPTPQPSAADPYAAQAPYPAGAYSPAPEQNPYGGYTAAPAYAGAGQAYPGNKAYVEQYFGPVAGFGKRALGLIIDTLLSLIGLIPFFVGLGLLTAGVGPATTDSFGNSEFRQSDGGLIAAGTILMILGGLVTLGITLWNRVFRMGRTGRSVGKSVVGLMLVDTKSGQPIGALKAFLRELVHGVVNQVFYLSYLWMLWDNDKQTLGDKAVASTVIEVPKKPA